MVLGPSQLTAEFELEVRGRLSKLVIHLTSTRTMSHLVDLQYYWWLGSFVVCIIMQEKMRHCVFVAVVLCLYPSLECINKSENATLDWNYTVNT